MLSRFAAAAAEQLCREDPTLYRLLEREYRRQQRTLTLVASCSPADPSALFCEGSFVSNVTAEGYPGERFHAGCEVVDEIERLAVGRARSAFQAAYADVQPHTASTANQAVLAALLEPGDTIMGMKLDAGGHLSHGASVNFSGRYFRAVGYGLTREGLIDYDGAAELARRSRPRLIVCGTTSYPRTVDWVKFRRIADEVGAWLLADITHIAGLVIAGLHPSPIDVAHVTTTCTHKQLYGPRGGLILVGKDLDAAAPDGGAPLSRRLRKAVFPFLQGAPIVNKIAAKARALERATTPEFHRLAGRIVVLAAAVGRALVERRVPIVSGGTDTHIVVADVSAALGITGAAAERALEECGIIVNRNRIPGDPRPPRVASGIRIGTNSAAARGFTEGDAERCAELVVQVLRAAAGGDQEVAAVRPSVRGAVEELCRQRPIPGYPTDEAGQ